MSKTAIIAITAMFYLGTAMLVGAGVDVWKIYQNRSLISKMETISTRIEALR